MTKRTIPKALFEPLERIQASDILNSDSMLELIKKETPLAIEEAFRAKKTFATLFEINGLGLFVDIPKHYWVFALEQCIAFNLEKEKFEDCIPIKNLIDEIRKKTKTISKTTKEEENGTGA